MDDQLSLAALPPGPFGMLSSTQREICIVFIALIGLLFCCSKLQAPKLWSLTFVYLFVRTTTSQWILLAAKIVS